MSRKKDHIELNHTIITGYVKLEKVKLVSYVKVGELKVTLGLLRYVTFFLAVTHFSRLKR